jgi:beta-lactam-binding protein with PASTA domain
VPDVREMLRDQAGTAVRDAGFVPAFTGTNRSDSWVVSQSPNAGEMLEGASTVTMQLRRGPIF